MKSNLRARLKIVKENMFLRFYFLLIIISFVECELHVVNRNTKYQIFIRNFVLQQFQNFSSIGILYNVSDPWTLRILQDANENFMATALVDYSMINISVKWNQNKQHANPKELTKTEGNIIIVQNTNKLCDILRYGQSYSFFSTRRHLLLVIIDSVKFSDLWMKEIFMCLWKVLIIDVAVLFDNEGRINIYTYVPWTNPFVLQNFTSPTNNTNIFYNKLKNLYGYPIKFVVQKRNNNSVNSSEYKDEVLSNMFLRATLSYRNATFVNEYYNLLKSQNDCKLKKSLNNIQFNVTCPLNLMSSNDNNVTKTLIDQNEWDKLKLLSIFNLNDNTVETSYPVNKDDFCILVPAGTKIPQAYNFFLALNINMWLHVVSCFIVYSLLLVALQLSGYKAEIRHSDKHYYLKKSCGLPICCILCKLNCDSPITKQEINKNIKQKNFLLPYILYCFLLNSAYKSILVSFLTKPLYYRSLQSLKDLNDTDLLILTIPDNLQFTPESVDPDIARILLSKIELDASIFENRPFVLNVTRGYFMRRSIASSMKEQDRYIDHNGKPMFHLMEECPVPSLVAYVFPRGSPLLEIIDELLSYIYQGMLHAPYILTGSKKQRSCSGFNCHELNDSKRNISFTLDHLQTIFYIYILGCTSATIAFFLELYTRRNKRRRE